MVATWGESSRASPTESMWLDLARRVRWGNVALTAALLIVIGGGIVRPLTRVTPPPLPSNRTVPLLSGEPAVRPPVDGGEPRAGEAAGGREAPGGGERSG